MSVEMGCRSRVKGRKVGTLGHSSHAVAGIPSNSWRADAELCQEMDS